MALSPQIIKGKQDKSATAMQDARAWLDGRSIRYLYLPPHQLKIGPLNFWPGTGTITIDGESGRRPENGRAGLETILSAAACSKSSSDLAPRKLCERNL